MMKKYPIIILFLHMTFLAFSQQFSHPYTRFGIGELHNTVFTRNAAMGDINTAWSDKYSFSLENPASYSGLKYTNYNIGLYFKEQLLKFNQQMNSSWSGNFSSLSVGLPLHKKYGIGAALGVVPLSDINYKTNYLISKNDSFTYNEIFSSKGGLSKAFVGTSFTFFKKISIGVDMEYIFGNEDITHDLEFPKDQNYLSVRKRAIVNYKNIGFKAGALFKHEFKNNFRLSLGASYASAKDVQTEGSLVYLTYDNDTKYKIIVDTITTKSDDISTTYIPMYYSLGFVLKKNKKWLIGADFRYQEWSKYKKIGELQNLQDAYEISIGGQIIPNYESLDSYFKRVAYRFGIKYAKSYLNLNENNFYTILTTVGAGMPLKNGQKIDLALQYGYSNSVGAKDVIIENYLKIYLAISIYDRWFKKSKIN